MLACLGAMLAACSDRVDGAAKAADRCTPFGNPPAAIAHRWLGGRVAIHRPDCDRGRLLPSWTDANGTERYACLYGRRHGADHPLPLVVFLHGSIASVDSIRLTGLVEQAERADLGGAERGFLLLAPSGRHTAHYYPGVDANALGWDNWYRQLAPRGVTIAGTTYEENADASAIDHFIQEVVATGEVDPRRIYLSGWSNGAAMAVLYALHRPSIAAAAVYSAPDPFGAFNDPCPQKPVAGPPRSDRELQVSNPNLAVMHVRNSCDIGGTCPNGNALAAELRSVGSALTDVILGQNGAPTRACEDACGTNPMAGLGRGRLAALRGLWNHLHWPSSWNARILEFLRLHPSPVRA